MPATKRFMNWTGTKLTVSPSSVIVNITGVTNVQIAGGGSLKKFSGDGDRYNTTVVCDEEDPVITVTTADETAVRTLTPGTRGTFYTVHNDAKNGNSAGGGAIAHTMSNAIVGDYGVGGAHKAYGSNTIVIHGESADGLTNPLASAAL